MSEIILEKRYPHSRSEDITDAFMRGYVEGKTDRPQGEWEEKEIFHNANDNPLIEEWQSARCSVCHKYHTTPYMYYFDNFNFCPMCGADMRGANDE